MAGQGRLQSKWTETKVDEHEARAVRALDRAQTESGCGGRIRWLDRALGAFAIEIEHGGIWTEWRPKQ